VSGWDILCLFLALLLAVLFFQGKKARLADYFPAGFLFSLCRPSFSSCWRPRFFNRVGAGWHGRFANRLESWLVFGAAWHGAGGHGGFFPLHHGTIADYAFKEVRKSREYAPKQHRLKYKPIRGIQHAPDPEEETGPTERPAQQVQMDEN